MRSWEKNVWGIYDFSSSTKLEKTVHWFVNEGSSLDGDICEFGVFKGRGLLAWALLCKELGLKKRVIGFDSFSGFPPIYHANDSLSKFKMLHDTSAITNDHYKDTVRLKEVRGLIKQTEISVKNISSSEDFSENPIDLLRRKIDALELDNIDLIVGDFRIDMVNQACDQVCLAIFDCDFHDISTE